MPSSLLTQSWKLKKSAKLFRDYGADQIKSLARLSSGAQSRKEQREFLQGESLNQKKKLVIFFIPDGMKVTGGRLQIFTLYRLSKEIYRDSDTSVVMCWIPGQGFGESRITSHENDVVVCSFWDVMQRCPEDCNLVIHIPEYSTTWLCRDNIGFDWLSRQAQSRDLHINILNQNIDSMVNRSSIMQLESAGCNVTITAAPSHWASPQEENRMGVPIHWLPTWYYSDAADWQPIESKKELMIVSHDDSPHREHILDTIRQAMPNLETRIIQSMPFEEYTKLEQDAKWSITFGEGCDGYFYGPAMRGGVSFAVYNETFTGWAIDEWQTLYSSYQSMAESIVSDMKSLDHKSEYEIYSKRLRERFSRYRSYDALKRQLEAFYKHDYSNHPIHDDELGCSAGYH